MPIAVETFQSITVMMEERDYDMQMQLGGDADEGAGAQDPYRFSITEREVKKFIQVFDKNNDKKLSPDEVSQNTFHGRFLGLREMP